MGFDFFRCKAWGKMWIQPKENMAEKPEQVQQCGITVAYFAEQTL